MNDRSRSTLAEFLGDRVIYRSLDPFDPLLPRYAELASRVGLASNTVPRKCQPGYALAVAELIQAASHRNCGDDPERILFVGDTRGNDVTAFGQLCDESGWPGVAFIGRDEQSAPAGWDVSTARERVVLYASRWRMLDEIDDFCAQRRFPIDDRTAVLIDIDKTAIGARGRNDKAIDRARIDALHRTLDAFLGAAAVRDSCSNLYDCLNQPSLHRLTADNQDIIAILCLAIAAGAISRALLDVDDREERLPDLAEVLTEASRRGDRLPQMLARTLRRFRDGARRGALPEFTEFRRNEYAATVERMGFLPESASREERMTEEITVTAEVRDAALRWRDRGALLLGLSDKPDAASVPDEAMAAAGYLPLHRTAARVVGRID